MNTRSTITCSAVVGALAWAAALPASAALVSCPTSFVTDGTAKVTDVSGAFSAASACQYLDNPDTNNVANATNVNAALFFGISTWELGGISQQSVSASNGTWTMPTADFSTYDYMLTFKNGAATNLVSFLLNGEFTSGLWTTPFTDPPFDFPGGSTSHDVSHFSLFRTTRTTSVPEPGTLALLGTGLLASVFVRRRKLSA